MRHESSSDRPVFDAYATDYDLTLAQGISVSGEDKNYFALGRVQWLARRLQELNENPGRILDFGCGTGTGAKFLGEQYGKAHVLGVDVSVASLEIGQRLYGSARIQFLRTHEYKPAAEMDLAFCNGVFHHIPVADRAQALKLIHRSLRPGGLFAFWENNPWNPGTRYVMSRIPFDREAITLTPPEARSLLSAGGFQILRTDFLFIFPRLFSWLRRLEPQLAGWPLGAQYLIIGKKIPTPSANFAVSSPEPCQAVVGLRHQGLNPIIYLSSLIKMPTRAGRFEPCLVSRINIFIHLTFLGWVVGPRLANSCEHDLIVLFELGLAIFASLLLPPSWRAPVGGSATVRIVWAVLLAIVRQLFGAAKEWIEAVQEDLFSGWAGDPK